MEEKQIKTNKFLSKFPGFTKKKRFYIPATLVILIVLWWAFFSGNGDVPNFETAIVENGSIVRIVSESGTVASADEVDLAFTTSGRISSVLVDKGESVTAGQVLVRLESTQAQANLAQAQAALRAAEARGSSSGGTSVETADQQDQLVANALKNLMTGDLQAYLVSGGYSGDQSFTQPTITGTYKCDAKGEYNLSLYTSSSVSGWSFRISGLENGAGSVSVFRPEPLGSCGLFIQFPEDFIRSNAITWSVPVPNVRSSTYATRLGAYEAALQARDLALQSTDNTSISEADIDQARAAVRLAEAVLAETSLKAPFSGTVTNLSAIAGAIASPSAPMLSLISDSRFEITVDIPEDDIIGVAVGDRAEVMFDAIDDSNLEAEVVYVAPAASNAEGAVSFEVILQLMEDDERVRGGLTADIDIFADSREDVVVVPVRAVIEEDGERFVRVMEDETTYRRVPVSVGLRGSGLYEITSGLSGGEKIITFANSAALSGLSDVTEGELIEE